MAEPGTAPAGQKYTTQQLFIGGFILLIIGIVIWYYTNSKSTVKLNSGTSAPPPGKNATFIPIVPSASPTAKKPFAKSNNQFGVGVYNITDFKKWYDAPLGEIIGEIKGTKDDWTIVTTSGGDKYVFTKEITTTLI